MSKPKNGSMTGVMFDLWRPPQGAGDPIGCLATTFTFDPGMFEEQCLAGFMDIESESSREDLAYVLERESRLGSVYAGVLVDHTEAGKEHSLRWDVLPVRIRSGKQHAKISLLVWSRHIRIIVASANLTEPGYRTNREVASAVDLNPEDCNSELLADAITFLRTLLLLVPGASLRPPEIQRVDEFLEQTERRVKDWIPGRRRGDVRQVLACTLPSLGDQHPARSSLEEAFAACRRRGFSPEEVWVASPFFDTNDNDGRVTKALCKNMARGGKRDICFCVPAIRSDEATAVPRLAAPRALLEIPPHYQGRVTVEMLPDLDDDNNRRSWHAKMLFLWANEYSALMVGSSNFTCAGMGVGRQQNAEANLLTIVDREDYGRKTGQLEAVWPDMDPVADPDSAEWLGAQPDRDEDEKATAQAVPEGFLSASYRAGKNRMIVLRFAPEKMPADWRVIACGGQGNELLSATGWQANGRQAVAEVSWEPERPPERLMVQWSGLEAFLPLNVEDCRELPPPVQLEQMSADDLLWMWSTTDPGAAFRAWAKRQQPSDSFDSDLDSATPIDLDPLRRYDLATTFLHRVRRRARVLAQLRANLQRPVWGRQALEWRLRGLVGVEVLANRMVKDLAEPNKSAGEALLTLADFLMVLREVEYQPAEGSLLKAEFNGIFRPFLCELVEKLCPLVEVNRVRVSDDIGEFWGRVVKQCRE